MVSVSKYQVATIQSIRSFQPPFTLQARVVGTVVSDEPFALVIASADGAKGDIDELRPL